MWGLLYLWDMKSVIRKLLHERIFDKKSEQQIELLNKFVDFAAEFLGITNPKVILQFKRDGLVTTASYAGKVSHIYAKDRALVDIMRSIGHELTHMKQDMHGELDKQPHDKNNEEGSPIENEANAKAGVMIRKFGKMYPEIYE